MVMNSLVRNFLLFVIFSLEYLKSDKLFTENYFCLSFGTSLLFGTMTECLLVNILGELIKS